MISCLLKIKDYCLSASIGCAPEEYQQKQEISVEIIIKFFQLPEDCKTDKLSDSYCYAQITDLITDICHQKHYDLIEHLADSIFHGIKNKLRAEDKLAVRLTKLKPPVFGLKGGAAFYCYDQELYPLICLS